MKKVLLGFTAFVLTASSLLAFMGGSAKASFVANHIIDDSVFDNTSTMTVDEINSFLNQFSGSCISTNHGFSAPDPVGYSPSNGYSYGGNVSGGQVIYDAAQAYDINPRVLLATLQKEQSLVTGGAGCSTLQYTGAVGYGCPDGGTTYSYSGLNLYTINGSTVTSVSGTCVNSSLKAGFSQQVIRGAWLLKFGEQRSEGNVDWAIIRGNWNNSDDPQSCYSGPMTQGTFKRCPSSTATFYDGYTSIDGSATHMDNGATASLYWYTPHFSGNQSFVSIWEGWWGDGSTFKPSFAWQNTGMTIMDEGQNAEIATDYMHPGERLFVRVTAQNTGSVAWSRDGANPLRLGTAFPFNHYTPYCDTTWVMCDRPATLEEATVAPGDSGHFDFYMAVPNNVGAYREYLRPVAEYQSWMSNDTGFNVYVRDTNQYNWQWEFFEAYTDSSKTTPVDMNNLAENQQVYVVVHVKNQSATVWNNSGSNPLRLGTANPQDQNSPLCVDSWISCNRPAVMDQASVAPGQDATFSFTIKAPGNTGVYRQYVKPVLEYKGWTRDDGNHIYLNVTH